jgi:hypothetical protein
VWWQYLIIVALFVLGIYGFVMLVRTMTRQLTRKTDRRAEDMYDEFGSARKEKDRWPVLTASREACGARSHDGRGRGASSRRSIGGTSAVSPQIPHVFLDPSQASSGS